MAQTMLRERIQSIEDAISAGQVDSAMADCQQILAHYPDALEVQRLLGEVYLAQGRLEEAQQTFDWILVNDPENVIAYCDRALICEHLSDIDTALDCYQQAYELSRGNSQIRQEFNQLSAKSGQQEFMLSRAGLARLYMRGDLLTQAMQEWEAVLAASPDRLDARLGLMETYWREGIYDQVEQLASRILEDIPNCEKALLLLAHVTSAFNMQRSRELVQRAELLDPELVMAQELFGDLAASQPHDPFLSIVRRDSIVLHEHTNGNGKQIGTISTSQYAAVEVENAALADHEAPADRLYNWNAQDALAKLDTRTMAQASAPPASEAPNHATWMDEKTIQQADSWKKQPEQKQSVDDFDAWASQQEIDDDYDPALLEQQPWFQAESSTASSSNDQPRDDSLPGLLDVSDPRNVPAQQRVEEVSAPPAWLDMLTKNERRQPEQPTSAPQMPEPEPTFSAYQPEPQARPASHQSWEDNLQTVPAHPEIDDAIPPFFFGSDDKEEDMGWPEWLKSLGAETIEPAPEAEAQTQPSYNSWSDQQQSVPSANLNSSQFESWLDQPQAMPVTSQPEEMASYDPWTEQPVIDSFASQEPAQFGTWEEQIDQTMSEDEREHLATLETLEKNLLSQGFVPLQPGALSTIAQESGLAPSSSSQETGQDAPEESPAEPTSTRRITAPIAASPATTEQPWWANVPFQAPILEAPSEPVIDIQQQEASMMPVYTPNEPIVPPVVHISQEAQEPVLATNRIEQITPATPLSLTYRPDAFLENELETTMKRPAVRLQPMQTTTARTDQAYPAGKGRSPDRVTGGRSGAGESNLSNKEQLVKGYQYQLAGAYDDAMQEYRITIRNAPELLGDVISNLRALLKLAPKYTAGYRVLGDAYMRQGEYLQAMEAYNKALTMAKKAKSQSH
jgi:tetratricopeptide (TPR) repeat protein